MKNIAVLIDFSEGSRAALLQGAALAKKTNSKLFGIHIVSSIDKVKQAEEDLKKFYATGSSANLDITTAIEVGPLTHATNAILKKIDAALVIICTHGVKGMMQQLFGANILKLVQAITYPCLVISDHTTADLSAANKILFPMGPHPDFMVKIKQTATLAKNLGATIILYWIDKPGADFDGQMSKNIELARDYFNSQNIPYENVTEDIQVISVGFSRQTMEYAANNNISLISVMANISKSDVLFGFGDKENFLVNEQGIAILTCNA